MEEMDLKKLSETLEQLQAMVDTIKAMIPADATSAVEEETEMEEAPLAESKPLAPSMGAAGAGDDEKALKKAAIMRALSKE
jgi:hypothetical protein